MRTEIKEEERKKGKGKDNRSGRKVGMVTEESRKTIRKGRKKKRRK